MRAFAPIRTVLKTSDRRDAMVRATARATTPVARQSMSPTGLSREPLAIGPVLASSSSSPKKHGLSTTSVEKYLPRLLDSGHESIHLSNDKRLILSRFPSIMIMKHRRFRSFQTRLRAPGNNCGILPTGIVSSIVRSRAISVLRVQN